MIGLLLINEKSQLITSMHQSKQMFVVKYGEKPNIR